MPLIIPNVQSLMHFEVFLFAITNKTLFVQQMKQRHKFTDDQIDEYWRVYKDHMIELTRKLNKEGKEFIQSIIT